MDKQKKIIVSIVAIIIVTLALIGITYAYFLTRISGNTNTKSIDVTTADLRLFYGDGNMNILTKSNITPGDEIGSKDFTVTNTGKTKVSGYVVYLEDVVNTFERVEDIVYTITCTSSDSVTCNGVDETIYPTSNTILITNDINSGATQSYVLTINYKEAGVDQSIDMNKKIGGKINIYDIKSINPYDTGVSANNNTLAFKIIDNAKNKNNGTELLSMPMSKLNQENAKYEYIEGNEDNLLTEKFSTYFTVPTDITLYYTYGDTKTFNSSTRTYNITNKDSSSLKAIQYNTNYSDLIGKYIVANSGRPDTSPQNGINLSNVYYVVNATSTGFDYVSYDGSGLANNEKYITYGDSYTFDKSTGKYLVTNKDGSSLKAVKYSENYKNLNNMYIITFSLSSSSTPINTYSADKIYRITDSSTSSSLSYKTITKSFSSVENILTVASDDYGDSYYYRGDVKDNYLSFNNMCFRIVRIEGDGSIKITLANEKGDCSKGITGTNNGFIHENDNVKNVAYNSGTTLTFQSEVATDAYNVLNNWFNTKFTDENILSKIKNDYWCYNDSIFNTTRTGSDENTIIHESYHRLTNNSTSYTNLKCFSGKYQSKVSLLNAEEVINAGFRYGVNYGINYLMDYSVPWWTLTYGSSKQTYNTNTYISLSVFDVDSNYLHYMSSTQAKALRPTITLNKDVIVTGDGTLNNPYIVESDI